MQIHRIDVDGVLIGRRLRPLNGEVVAALAESMKRFGLLNPISVYAPDDSAAWLVTGYHRLEAARRLGWDFIDGVFVDGDEIDRELREITENLHRAELTALERSEQIARWAELTVAKVSQSATPCGGDQPHEKGIRKVARDLKLDKDDVQRAVKVSSLSDEAKRAARDAELDDNRSALLAAAQETSPEKQVAKISEIAAAKVARSGRAPKIADNPLNDRESAELQVAALMSAWNKASREAREEFLLRIGQPAMDRRHARV